MLEKLVGRLKWERTGNGIRVEIPAQLNWTVVFFLVWLAGWTMAGRSVLAKTLAKPSPPAFDFLWLVGWAFGECFVAVSIIWSLTGRTALEMDPCQLAITRQVLGIRISRRIFSTTDVRNLRYNPIGNRRRHSYQSRIKFEADSRTCSFGAGLEDAEAFALIDKMLEVYKFPKERALEYLDLSS